ncbi:hypothetical protein LTS08_001003 [Lithohypha guttulata]|nr:hypothetical protein LTS08_001003 [Lithohypha guttulata]
MKRPPEKTATSRAKRPKASRPNEGSSPTGGSPKKYGSFADQVFDGQDLDEDDLTNNVQGKLANFNKHLRARKSWAENFRTKIRTQNRELIEAVEQAKDEVQRRQEAFKQAILPVLAGSLNHLDTTHDPTTPIHLPLFPQPVEQSPAIQKACEVVAYSETLLACYDILRESPLAIPDITKMKDVFEKDKAETIKAFEISKKMAINRLQAQLSDVAGGTRERFALDEGELHLAKKIIYGTNNTSAGETAGAGIGSLMHDFGKVVSEMQNLLE